MSPNVLKAYQKIIYPTKISIGLRPQQAFDIIGR